MGLKKQRDELGPKKEGMPEAPPLMLRRPGIQIQSRKVIPPPPKFCVSRALDANDLLDHDVG